MPIRVKMPHCWKSHVAAHISKTEEMTDDSLSTVLRIRRVIFRECFVQVIFIKLTRGGAPSQFIKIMSLSIFLMFCIIAQIDLSI